MIISPVTLNLKKFRPTIREERGPCCAKVLTCTTGTYWGWSRALGLVFMIAWRRVCGRLCDGGGRAFILLAALGRGRACVLVIKWGSLHSSLRLSGCPVLFSSFFLCFPLLLLFSLSYIL